MNNTFEGYGEAIRIVRKRRGWSQREFGELAGVSPYSISRYERQESVPDILVLGKLLATAEMSLSQFEQVLKLARKEVDELPAPDSDLVARMATEENLTESEQRVLAALARIVSEEQRKDAS